MRDVTARVMACVGGHWKDEWTDGKITVRAPSPSREPLCAVSPLARELAAYFSYTFTEWKQIRGRIKMQASEKDSLVSAWNLFCGSGNLIPRLTFCVPLDFVNGKKITLWPPVKTVWINFAYLPRVLKDIQGFQVFREKSSPDDNDHYRIYSTVACCSRRAHFNQCSEIANHK